MRQSTDWLAANTQFTPNGTLMIHFTKWLTKNCIKMVLKITWRRIESTGIKIIVFFYYFVLD